MSKTQKLTHNQQALVNLLASTKFRLENCVGGYAIWDNEIGWSQGRTPNNAIRKKDIMALVDAGLLENADFGRLRPTYTLYASVRQPWVDFTPANEGYRGPAFA